LHLLIGEQSTNEAPYSIEQILGCTPRPGINLSAPSSPGITTRRRYYGRTSRPIQHSEPGEAMTIPFDKLHLIAASLEKYRQSGLLKFDGRDAGNYHVSCWNDQAALLEAADPTGLALAMLLAEMIEATIKGSLVKLERIPDPEGAGLRGAAGAYPADGERPQR
jgi:hypothetical protein